MISQDNLNVVITGNKTEFFNNNELYRVDNIYDTLKTTHYYKNGMLHNENGPAIIYDNGKTLTQKWYINDKQHRENDLPAVIEDFGDKQTKEWYLNGERHRDNDLPAIEHYSGHKEWYVNGQKHRDNGPAIEGKDNLWIKNGLMHREDGPALEINGGIDGNVWYKDGFVHREDGPASIINGVEKWHLEGKQYTKEAFDQELLNRANVSSFDKSFIGNAIKTLRENFLPKSTPSNKNNIK